MRARARVWERPAVGTRRAVPLLLVAALLAASFLLAALIGAESRTSSSTSSSSVQSTVQGVVAGTVAVGPSQPVCMANQSCTVSLSGYSLEFTSQCGTPGVNLSSCTARAYDAPISPSGHYSILLPPGNYSLTGLLPSCEWVGCASAFPKSVAVEPGSQLTVNVDVDTGIR